MKKIFYWLSLCLFLYAHADSQMINKVKAVVNSEVITSNQFNQAMQIVINNLKAQQESNIPQAQIESQVLQNLILERLQLQMAKRLHIEVSEQELAQVIKNIAAEHGLTPMQLQSNIIQQGLSFEQFESQIAKQIILHQLRQGLIDSKLNISKDTVLSIYNSEIYKNQVNYKLAVIRIGLPPSRDSTIVQQQRKIAQDAYLALIAGRSFAEVVMQYSTAPNTQLGGELGWKSGYTLSRQITSALDAISIGQITPVLQLADGFYIFKLEDKTNIRHSQMALKYHVRILTRHIDRANNSISSYNKLVKLRQNILDNVNSTTSLDSVFTKYAKQYSDDSSSITGGDMGWIALDGANPILESVVVTSGIANLSQPFKFNNGWSILEVIETKKMDISKDLELQQIKQNLIQARSTVLYNQWLNDLRSNAYIRIFN